MILGRVRKATLKLKVEKCTFLWHEVRYLGHSISKMRIPPDPDKTVKDALMLQNFGNFLDWLHTTGILYVVLQKFPALYIT